ncbi:hypothetical protein ACFU53_01230 [Streptomyces sp. NPDC057474]|uniref:hypothetical protein n=1 Tax=Streptomyces sp. NPDC057474 TaxID=3346144 RepID=UPI00369DD55E
MRPSIAALGQLRAANWPTPEDPDGSDDEEQAGRARASPSTCTTRSDGLRQCAERIDHLEAKPYQPSTMHER